MCLDVLDVLLVRSEVSCGRVQVVVATCIQHAAARVTTLCPGPAHCIQSIPPPIACALQIEPRITIKPLVEEIPCVGGANITLLKV